MSAGVPSPATPKRINLALQGGGAHGAFTWGVLDVLLADPRLAIEGISGTSAGAMNAAVLACGLAAGGPEKARAKLRSFWQAASLDGGMPKAQRAVFDMMMGLWEFGSGANWLGIMPPTAAPVHFNPLDINPLRDVVESHIDFDALRAFEALKLFIVATNVQTGKGRVFRRDELTADMLMASAALPQVFRPVEIDGVPYWDGGYSGNPALYPFFTETETEDIVLVQINPITRPDTPDSSREITERLNEITFNASLLHEFRAIDFVRRLIDSGRLQGTHYKRIRMHRIDGEHALNGLGASSKLKADWDFFLELHALGRQAAHKFLARNFDQIGVEGTLDLAAELA
jgi:NTE family protein